MGKVYKEVKTYVAKDLALRTLDSFLNNLAYEAGNELATGGIGRKVQFRTESLNKVLHAVETRRKKGCFYMII